MCELQTNHGELIFDEIDMGLKSILDEPFHPFFGNISDKCMDEPSCKISRIEDSTEMGKKTQLFGNVYKRGSRKLSGKACGVPRDGGNIDKKEETELLWSNVVESQSAFLGPNLWDNKTIPYDNDLKYCDLDEFLSENGLPVEGDQHNGTSGGNGANVNQGSIVTAASAGSLMPGVNGRLSPPPPASLHPIQHLQANGAGGVATILTKREPSPSPSEPLSPITINPPSPADSTLSFASSSRDFDPRTRPFSDEELKPQPMFVPDGLKDEKYWARRRKNNMAAKRSRDARRMKENQIALRAGFLEKENMGLRQEMERLKKENLALRDRLSKFTNEI
ncbi:hepatic leukemia factor-like isoform X2 [Daktulosphaira vitifoliae]|uniref:hepatic leukemia factor-like isoform X2 n=1 Tax=Daktulosphaira vitifoliae TaxID=58002 RepID=UPI0021AA29C8|nr:hepatic leukemia factor-like isoform X2 [Daktulosphaira vitifoliae]